MKNLYFSCSREECRELSGIAQSIILCIFLQAIKSPRKAGVLSAVIIVIELWFVQLDSSSVT
jgi:hypothetical protein